MGTQVSSTEWLLLDGAGRARPEHPGKALGPALA
jgi:hypothetical protein